MKAEEQTMNLKRLVAAAASAAVLATMTPVAAMAVPQAQKADSPAGSVREPVERLSHSEDDGHTHGDERHTGMRNVSTKALRKAAGLSTSATTQPTDYTIPNLLKNVNQSCTGSGVDGKRVQMIYVREPNKPDRFASVVPIARNEAQKIDNLLAVSAKKNGNGGRRVRWVTNSDCSVSVQNAVLPTGSLTGGNLWQTRDALEAAGLLKPDRLYLVLADTTAGNMMSCGQAEAFIDSHPDKNVNQNNRSAPRIGRIDTSCWVSTSTPITESSASPHSTIAHELWHMLGAVHPDAPTMVGRQNGTHCLDDYDLMCSGGESTDGWHLACPDKSWAWLLDCGGQDYFNTNPPAGSYLATHWNTANSSYLDVVPALPDPPAVTVTVDRAVAEVGDVVTWTASNVPANATIQWHTDARTDLCPRLASSANTYRMTCSDHGGPTVTATVSYPGGYLTNTARATTQFNRVQNPPHVVISGPSEIGIDTNFNLVADVENKKDAYTYTWTLPGGCRPVGAVTNATLTATCDPTAVWNPQLIFSVVAKRTLNGTEISGSTRVELVAVGDPTLTLTGPTSVTAGGTYRFTATGGNTGGQERYTWRSSRGWLATSPTGSSVNVAVPAGAVGSDTLTVTLETADGRSVTRRLDYNIIDRLTLTKTGPDSLQVNEENTFYAEPNYGSGVTMTWAVNNTACTIHSGDGQYSRNLACGQAANNTTVNLTATANHPQGGSATATFAIRIGAPVAPPTPNPPPTSKSDTTLTYTKKGFYPTFTVKVGARDKTPQGRVQFEYAANKKNFKLVNAATLSNGTAKWKANFNGARGKWRIKYVGSDTHNASQTSTFRLKPKTKFKVSRMKKNRIKGVLKAGSVALKKQKVTLQKRVGKKWKAVTTKKTNQNGVVIHKMANSKKKVSYRWVFTKSKNYKKSTSRTIRF